MKKLLGLLSAFVVLTSCTKEGPPGPQGEPAEFLIEEFVVFPGDWTAFGDYTFPGFGYEANFYWPALTASRLGYSQVNVFRRYGDQLVPLPITRFTSGYDSEGNYFEFFSVTDYIVAPQSVNFATTDSDGFTQQPVENMVFRVVVSSAKASKAEIYERLEEETSLKVVEKPDQVWEKSARIRNL